APGAEGGVPLRNIARTRRLFVAAGRNRAASTEGEVVMRRKPGLFTCRRTPARRKWAVLLMIMMIVSTLGRTPAVRAQVQVAPIGNGFVIDAADLRFIFHQIQVAQAHAAGGALLGPGPNQVNLFGVPNPQ